MRTVREMFALFERVARSDERIRALTLEGSRVNPSVTPDVWQDYDITFWLRRWKVFSAVMRGWRYLASGFLCRSRRQWSSFRRIFHQGGFPI